MSKKIKRIICCLFCMILCLQFSVGCNSNEKRIDDERNLSAYETSIYNLAGTDALGRKVNEVDGVRDSSVYVGMWYSFWHGQHTSLQTEIRDIQKLLDSGDEGVAKLKDLSDWAQFYYWGEPLYGYYNSMDPFVIARHIELFTNAGIDFLLVDVTNAYVYKEVGYVFLDMLLEFQNQGFKVPKMGFYTNTNSGTTVNTIYNTYYKSGKYEDLWFKPNGKPLIVGITENNNFASDQTRYWNTTDFVSSNMQAYFEVKESQWPNGEMNLENGMPWMSWTYPQSIHSGYTSVAVAQHDYNTTYFSSMSPSSHRGYDNVTQTVQGDYREGLSFQQQWDSLEDRKDEISTVFICCWNEWIAQKQPNGAFIDVYNWEYSRDLEMMKGGYGDNFYMQLVKNVREFKYDTAKKYNYTFNEIDVSVDDSTWDNVLYQFKDFKGDAIKRDFKDAAGKENYVDNSARNDITDISVTHDANNLYFRIETAEKITEYNGKDKNWMNILLSVDSSDNSFEGYQYIINRNPSNNETSVEKSKGGYSWENIGSAEYKIIDNVMLVSIPLDTLGLSQNKCYIQFKVSDNVTNPDDIMDYYISGDCAPLGRLNYSYGL